MVNSLVDGWMALRLTDHPRPGGGPIGDVHERGLMIFMSVCFMGAATASRPATAQWSARDYQGSRQKPRFLAAEKDPGSARPMPRQ